MTDLESYISSYFQIPTETIPSVRQLFAESHLPKGEHFLKSGQFCEKLSFLQSGFMRIYADAGDKEITQWISAKGHFVTDLFSFIFDQRARWNIEALTDCKLYTMHKGDYGRLRALVPNWDVIEKQLIAGCFITLEDRVFQHLSLSAEERYEKFFESNRELFTQVPLQYLASMLGMSPETLSRIRKKKLS